MARPGWAFLLKQSGQKCRFQLRINRSPFSQTQSRRCLVRSRPEVAVLRSRIQQPLQHLRSKRLSIPCGSPLMNQHNAAGPESRPDPLHNGFRIARQSGVESPRGPGKRLEAASLHRGMQPGIGQPGRRPEPPRLTAQHLPQTILTAVHLIARPPGPGDPCAAGRVAPGVVLDPMPGGMPLPHHVRIRSSVSTDHKATRPDPRPFKHPQQRVVVETRRPVINGQPQPLRTAIRARRPEAAATNHLTGPGKIGHQGRCQPGHVGRAKHGDRRGRPT